MRLELFGKDVASLRAEARTLVGYGALGLNVPHKSKDSPPLATLQALQDVLPPDVLRECVPHYSLKFAYDRSAEVTRQSFVTFCAEAAALPTPPRQLLLVSGSGQRKFDTVQCLKSLPQEHSDAIGIGVAFNPYIPDRAQREHERARLRLKVGTGRVSAIWLQLGSDLELLADGLQFLETLTAERRDAAMPLRLYGSVFVPSRQLLARMKFRPWNGVYLSEHYLSSVEGAEEVTRAAVALYAVHGVEVFVETAVRSRAELEHVRKLLELDLDGGDATPAAAMPAAAMPAGSVRASAADQAAAARLSSVTPLATPAGSSAGSSAAPSASASASAAAAASPALK